MNSKIIRIALLLSIFIYSCVSNEDQPDALHITIDLNQTNGKLSHAWAMFGHDEPNYTYMPDGKKLLTDLAKLSPVPVYVRTHNLLSSGDGSPALKWGSTNIYTEDENGDAVYSWQLVDSIFDTYVQRNMRPLVEIGFMPKDLSVKPEPYKHSWRPGAPYEEIYTGWAYPPKDYEKWAELIYQWVLHCVDRYGKDEVEQWYWELWNEPNIGYWQGSLEEYLKLYDYTADAVKRALPSAIFGGPHTTGPSWDVAEEYLKAFLEHCLAGQNHVTNEPGAPLDFIGFHAKGRPVLQDSIILMNMGTQLRDISKGFEIVSSYPQLMNTPIIIGESDPEGCAACSMQDYPENAYRNGTMYSSYTAASFPRKYELADAYGVNLRGIVTWAFEFEDQPWFNGYRSLATNGINKPVVNIFRMFGKMAGDRVTVTGDLAYDYKTVRDSSVRGEQRDISAMATINDTMATVLLWNYHDLNTITPAVEVSLKIQNIPARKVYVNHYRVDQEHSNAYEVWKSMGSPQQISKEQYRELEEAAKLEQVGLPEQLKLRQNELEYVIQLPGQAVSLLVLTWEK